MSSPATDGRHEGAIEAMATIESATAQVRARLTPDIALLLGLWGAVYLVAGGGWFAVAAGIADVLPVVITTVVAVVAAAVVSGVLVARTVRGVQGPGSAQGAAYGFSWPIALLAVGALATGADLDAAQRLVVVPVLVVLVVGLLFLMSGVVFGARPQYAGGAVMVLAAAVAVFVPVPAHLLVLTAAVAGPLLGLAAWYGIRRPRPAA